jgi:uncharacterized protein
MMLEWPLLFCAGFLGSAHCVGMCGGFVVSIGAATTSWRDNLSRQLLYSAGRIFTYSILGAAAGFAGWRLARLAPSGLSIAAWLAIGAGCLLVLQGLASAGLLRRRVVGAGQGACLASSFFGGMLRLPGRSAAFLAGLLTGLLPCGLLYGMIAMAASTRDLLLGAGSLAIFGLGTLPVMVLTGCGGGLLGIAGRRRLYLAAAWCLILTGGISIARGVVFLAQPRGESQPACPFCLVPAGR